MIDYSAIKAKFVKVAKDCLGSSVTKVIQSHPNAPQPARPYVTVDLMMTRDEHGWLTHTYVDNNNNPVYETNKQIVLVYRVVGKDAHNLANNLHAYWNIERVRQDIRSTVNVGIVELGRIRDLPTKISDMLFDETSEFEITINVTDVVVDTQTGIIDSTTFTVEVHDGEGDPDPFITTFDIPPDNNP